MPTFLSLEGLMTWCLSPWMSEIEESARTSCVLAGVSTFDGRSRKFELLSCEGRTRDSERSDTIWLRGTIWFRV